MSTHHQISVRTVLPLLPYVPGTLNAYIRNGICSLFIGRHERQQHSLHRGLYAYPFNCIISGTLYTSTGIIKDPGIAVADRKVKYKLTVRKAVTDEHGRLVRMERVPNHPHIQEGHDRQQEHDQYRSVELMFVPGVLSRKSVFN